jgi:DNA-binding transcriptional ArsR family regulator
MSYEKRDKTPIVLVRSGFEYRYVPMERMDKSPMAVALKLEENRNKVQDFITEEFAKGVKITKSELDDHKERLGLSRKELRTALKSLLDMGLVTVERLPANERRTSRNSYLHPATAPKLAKSAEARQSSPGELTNRSAAGEPKFAAGGTSIRRRTSKAQNRPKKTRRAEPGKGEVRRNSITHLSIPRKRLNGAAVHG